MNKTITFADKLTAWFALLSGLSISAVAVWYSVAGLVAIFAASVVPIIIMGVVLEIGKLVATVWLKQNWDIAPKLIRLYLFIAVIILMLITSMGIFGFLSKAHLDQTLVSGDVQSQIVLVNEKIKIERENIANAQSVIKQMDAAVNGVMATGDQEIKLRDGTTQIRSAAERSLQIRRSQAPERAGLTKQIEQSQSRIVKLQEESAPIRAQVRKVEAEVGPIKYIAALLYNDNPDSNTLEKAVRWVIISIVIIFDPLAVVLLLASQYSFAWFRRQEEQEQSTVIAVPVVKSVVPEKKEPTITMLDSSETTNIPEDIVTAYPANEQDIAEFAMAKEEAKEKVWDQPVEKTDSYPPFEGIKNPNSGVWEQTGPAFKELKAVAPVMEAPPGTPGEVWDAPIKENSGQQPEDNLDKIYKESTEKLARKNRSNSWFQAAFPKRDDK